MSAPKWTPGPWEAHAAGTNNRWGASVSANGKPIASCRAYPRTTEARTQANANAVLIAAAPELAEACEAAYAYLAPIDNDWPGRHTQQGQRLLCDLRDAIAKATGIDPEAVQDAHSVSAALRKARWEG